MKTIEKIPSYNPPIADNLRSQYESLLKGVVRWEEGLLLSTVAETDLDHVRDMLLMLEDIKQKTIYIPSEINFRTVSHMAYIHDAGEILTRDLSHSHPDYDTLKPLVRKREKAAFRLMTRSIENEETRELARELYKRCVTKDPSDKEAQLANFVDKAQAVRFGAINVFPGDRITNPLRRAAQLDHAVDVLLKPGGLLVSALKFQGSKREAIDLIGSELGNFTSNGYSKEEMQQYFERVSKFS